MTMIELRDYRHPEDYAAVVALWERCGPGVQLSRSDQPEEIRKKLEHDPDLFVLAVAEGEVVGTVVGGYDGRRGLVYHLAVEAAHRRRGLGRQLMEEIEDRLRQRGCLKCYLLVAAEGGQALDFYRDLGWQPMDVTLMGKELL
jgi:ribosomal protein S18 acetylase RimI-like enzyme